MPKELTHWIVAEHVFNGLDRDSRLFGIISRHKKEYLAGAVLPDTLLHVFKGPYAKAALTAAHCFHNSSGNSYDPLILVESGFNQALPDSMLACLLGVISHMQADIVFHPYVFARTGTTDIGSHYRLETDMDIYLTTCSTQPPVMKLVDLMTPETEQTLASVAEVLFSGCSELPHRVILDALKLHCRFQSMYSGVFWKVAVNLLGALLGAPFRQQRHLFYPADFFGKKDFKHMKEAVEWTHPVTGKVRNSKIDDLVEDAVKQSIEVFRLIEASDSLAAALTNPPGCNLLTGMYAVTGDKMSSNNR